MARLARLVLLAALAALGAMFFEPFFSAMLLGLGLDTAKLAPPVIAWVRGMTTQLWFLPALLVLLGLTGGAWLDAALRRADAADRVRESTFMANLVNDLAILSEKFTYFHDQQETRPVETLWRYAQEFESILTSLERRGFRVPRIDLKTDPLGYMEVAIRYADRVGPFLKRGLLIEAQAASAEETTQSFTYMANRARL